MLGRRGRHDRPAKVVALCQLVKTTMIDRPPTVFISYAWEGDAHETWVKDLATRLRTKDGLDVHLDRWEVGPPGQTWAGVEARRWARHADRGCQPAPKPCSDVAGRQ